VPSAPREHPRSGRTAATTWDPHAKAVAPLTAKAALAGRVGPVHSRRP